MSRMATNIANKPLLNLPAPESRPCPLSHSRTPIFVRRHVLTGDAAEKQALTQAARALAQRWNVSPKRVR